MNNDYYNIALPKWPGVLVVGKPVTEEQAAEILIRTDDFSFCSNDKSFEEDLHFELFGVKSSWSMLSESINIMLKELPDEPESYQAPIYWEKVNTYKSEKLEPLRLLDLNYMQNSRIISSWVGGPHGWCNWDGAIGCRNYNIGKYPSVEDILEDWKLIAKEFPFLDLKCQILSHEIGCEEGQQDPLIEFVVKKGKVNVKIPTKSIAQGSFGADAGFLRNFSNLYSERGCSIQKFRESLDLVKNKFK